MDTTAKFALTANDAVAGFRLYAWAGMTNRRALMYWLLLWIIVFAVFSALLMGRPFDAAKLWANAPVVLFWSLVPFLLVVLVTVIGVPITARRTFREQRSLRGEMNLAWTAETLHIESEYGVFDMPWGHFLRWHEDSRSFLLYESQRLIRIIPKRVLNDAQQQSLRVCLGNIDERASRASGK